MFALQESSSRGDADAQAIIDRREGKVRSRGAARSWKELGAGLARRAEKGVAMLSSVPRSERAVQVNMGSMRAFVQMRAMVAGNRELARKVAELEKRYDGQVRVVFEALEQLMEEDEAPARQIGFMAGTAT